MMKQLALSRATRSLEGSTIVAFQEERHKGEQPANGLEPSLLPTMKNEAERVNESIRIAAITPALGRFCLIESSLILLPLLKIHNKS